MFTWRNWHSGRGSTRTNQNEGVFGHGSLNIAKSGSKAARGLILLVARLSPLPSGSTSLRGWF